MRVARDEQLREPRLQLGDAGGELVGLLGEPRVLDGELARGGEVGTHRLQLARRPDDLTQLGVAPPQLAGLARVGVHGGVGERALQLRVLHQQRVDGGRGHSSSSGHENGAHRSDGRRLSSYFLAAVRLP